MAGGLIGMNLERGQQAQSTLLGLAARESAMNAANQQIEAAKKAGQLTTVGTGAGIGARLGVAAAEKAATTTAAAGTPVAGFFSPTGGAAALNTGATAAGATAAGTTAAGTAGATAGTAAAAEGAAAATTAAGAGGTGGAAGIMAAAPWVLGGMAVAYLLSELFD